MKTNTPFHITINDGFCSWTYPLNIGDDYSIKSVHAKICRSFRVKEMEGWNGNLEDRPSHKEPEKQPYTQESWTGQWIREIESGRISLVLSITDDFVEINDIYVTWKELMKSYEFGQSMHGPFHPCFR